jgi:hypothetical protein
MDVNAMRGTMMPSEPADCHSDQGKANSPGARPAGIASSRDALRAMTSRSLGDPPDQLPWIKMPANDYSRFPQN